MRFVTASLLTALVLTGCTDSDKPVRTRQYVKEDAASNVAATVESGTLASSDNTLSGTGEYVDRYETLAREGQWIWIELLSTDFDPYVILRPPVGDQIDVDDSQLGNQSLAKSVVQATTSGKWIIDVTSYSPGETGAYELSYKVTDQRPADADEGRQVTEEP